jgi:hypothetical protein
VLPEVTRSDMTGKGLDRKYVLRMPGFFPHFVLTIAVVQVPWLPEVTKGDPFGVPLGVRMHNRKLCNIRPNGAFSPEEPLGVFSRTSASIVF